MAAPRVGTDIGGFTEGESVLDTDIVRQPGDHAGEADSMSAMLSEAPARAAAQAAPAPDPDAEAGPRIRPITVAEYNRMAEAGILGPDERVELVDGLLIVPPPMGDAHWKTVAWMQHRIALALGEQTLVTSQLPLIVSDVSEPEPDVMLVRIRNDRPGTGVPRTPDVIAVVEVADSSLRFDRREKLAMYARAGIPEYWVVNVRAEQIEIHRDPQGEAYPEPRIAKKGETVAFAAFPDAVFTVDELLG